MTQTKNEKARLFPPRWLCVFEGGPMDGALVWEHDISEKVEEKISLEKPKVPLRTGSGSYRLNMKGCDYSLCCSGNGIIHYRPTETLKKLKAKLE